MTVKRGSVTVRIYRQKSIRGYTTFMVAHYAADGRLERASFADLEEARTHAQDVADRLNHGQGLNCSHRLRLRRRLGQIIRRLSKMWNASTSFGRD